MAGSSKPNDPDALIRRAKAGDPVARRQLVLRRHTDLANLIRADLNTRLRARVDPEDVLQDVYIKILRGFDRFEGTTLNDFRQWARSIARNTVREMHRRYIDAAKRDVTRAVRDHTGGFSRTSIQLVAALEGHMTTASGRAVRLEALESLSAALALLPEHYRQVIELRFFQGLSVAQTAAKTGRTKGAVLMISHRAMREMARIIREFPLLTRP